MIHKTFLQVAIEQANLSVEQGGFPAGSVIVKDETIITRGISIGSHLHDPTSHAETASIREACKLLQTINLAGSTLYASMEPCILCFSGACWSGISRIVYGCKRTEEMVRKGYYLGKTDINVINQENNRPLEIIFIPDYEKDVLELINGWEKSVGL